MKLTRRIQPPDEPCADTTLPASFVDPRPETSMSRWDYFNEVFDRTVLPLIVPHTQPELWYRDGWQPCKDLHIRGSRMARREIYNANFRQWHWRVAGEQLIYSHVDRMDHEDASSPFRYALNKVRHLLVGSAEDNYSGSNIFDATMHLAGLMVTTPGRSLLLRETGHSVHFERPAFFAGQIVSFLLDPALGMEITCIRRAPKIIVGRHGSREIPDAGRIVSVGGVDRATNTPFTMTVRECIDTINSGIKVFVMGPFGGRVAVRTVSGRYLRTVHDGSPGNNLSELFRC